MTAFQTIQPSRAGQTRRGFSLIELAVVLIITAILAAVAVPAVASIGTTRQKLAARQLVRDLAFARHRAISTGRVHWVTFRTSSDTYTILEEPAGSTGRVNAAALTDPATGRSFSQQFNSGEFVGVDLLSASISSGTEIGFDWLGRPKATDSEYLTSTAIISITGASISIVPETGLATWQ